VWTVDVAVTGLDLSAAAARARAHAQSIATNDADCPRLETALDELQHARLDDDGAPAIGVAS